MTNTSTTTSRRTGKGERGRRARLSAAQREAADAARAAKIAALHEQIGERVEQLTAGPQWRAMLDAAELQAARLGISPPRVAGFGTCGSRTSSTSPRPRATPYPTSHLRC